MATMFRADKLPEVLTIEEPADLLRISRNSAYALARLWRDSGGQEGLPVIELGGNPRVPRIGLQRLLNCGGHGDIGRFALTGTRPRVTRSGPRVHAESRG